MNEDDHAPDGFTVVERFGEGFAAGCRLLQSRYYLSEDAAFLITAAVIATAIGPAVHIRHPLGGDLPLSLDIAFCAEAQGPVSAAIFGAFRFFREIVGTKAIWHQNIGNRRLRAEFLETLTALEAVEQLLRHAAPPITPPPALVTAPPDPDDLIRRTKLERENREAHRDQLRAELAERRMDLAPFLIAEDPGWDTVLALDKLAFDNCFTAISTDGAMCRELLASSPKQMGKVARLLQASRHGRNLTDGTSVVLNPVLISLQVVSPDLVASALMNKHVRDGGLLQGIILEVPETTTAYDAAAFVDDADETIWVNFLSTVFTQRARGTPQLYLLDRCGFDLLEDFRRWCRVAVSEHPDLKDFAVEWPGLVLKLALCLHLAAGKSGQETLDLVTVGTVAELIKSVGGKQLELLERLLRKSAVVGPRDDGVAGMVAKLDELGGAATMRKLFRRYSGQDYDLLTPILEEAVSTAQILRDGKRLWLPSRSAANPSTEVSTSTRQR